MGILPRWFLDYNKGAFKGGQIPPIHIRQNLGDDLVLANLNAVQRHNFVIFPSSHRNIALSFCLKMFGIFREVVHPSNPQTIGKDYTNPKTATDCVHRSRRGAGAHGSGDRDEKDF